MLLKLCSNPGFNLTQIGHLTFIRIGVQNFGNRLDMCVDLGFFGWGHDQYTPQEWLKRLLYKTCFSTAKDDMLPKVCLFV
jgi:hypothetical protein